MISPTGVAHPPGVPAIEGRENLLKAYDGL